MPGGTCTERARPCDTRWRRAARTDNPCSNRDLCNSQNIRLGRDTPNQLDCACLRMRQVASCPITYSTRCAPAGADESPPRTGPDQAGLGEDPFSTRESCRNMLRCPHRCHFAILKLAEDASTCANWLIFLGALFPRFRTISGESVQVAGKSAEVAPRPAGRPHPFLPAA